MAFTLEQFTKNRPFSYHNTSLNNLASIRAERQLHCAAALLRASGRSDLLRVRRTSALSVQIDSQQYSLQTQQRLCEGNIKFLDGWTLPHLVEAINCRVFFWPGGITGPTSSGKLHSKSKTGPSESVVLRVPTPDVLRENSQHSPLFSPYNSGYPRCSHGNKSPRGPDTFVAAGDFSGGWGSVVELTFVGNVQLPKSTRFKRDSKEQWEQL